MPLTEAAYNGRTDSVKALLEAGANVNTKDKDGRTALMWDTEDKYPDCVKTLLEAGADVNVKDKDGKTALMRSNYNEPVSYTHLQTEKRQVRLIGYFFRIFPL